MIKSIENKISASNDSKTVATTSTAICESQLSCFLTKKMKKNGLRVLDSMCERLEREKDCRTVVAVLEQ